MAQQAVAPQAPAVMDGVESCQQFLTGVLTTPGYLERGLSLIEPNGMFFCDAMEQTNLEDFVRVQQGFFLDTLPDFTLLNWRHGFQSGDTVAVKFQATASHSGDPVQFGETVVEPTGKRATWTCAWIFTLRDGKVAELEKNFDRGSFHAGLGWPPYEALPVQPPAG
jgi:hypothetical protein